MDHDPETPADHPTPAGGDPAARPGGLPTAPEGAALSRSANPAGVFTPDVLPPDAAAQGPLREIATAFRMNAEALHTLREMQSSLAESVKRGDRSDLVLQSTRALNDTFRNLTAVQRELLSRLDGSRPVAGGGRSPLIPMLILGLLVVLLGGIYVILDTIETQGAKDPQLAPGEVARRERDSWKEGRREGAQHADAEIRRLTESLEEAKARARKFEQDVDAKQSELGLLERGKRTAELERDEFAGQVRKAQGEMLAKKALEEEILSLTAKADRADRLVREIQLDLDLQRRTNAFLRDRLADHGMGFTEDDPPWRPGQPAGEAPPDAPGRITKLEPTAEALRKRRELLIMGRKKMGLPTDDLEREMSGAAPASGSSSDESPPARQPSDPAPGFARSAVPPPAAKARDEAGGGAGNGSRPAPRGAAYGGDDARTLPPPSVMRKLGSPQRDPKAVKRVQAHVNRLLDNSASESGRGMQGWQVRRVSGVAGDRLEGVVLARYDRAGRLVESIEAADLRITLDRERKAVEFNVRDGVRIARNRSTPLPGEGARIVVAEGAQTDAWGSSPLTVIKKR